MQAIQAPINPGDRGSQVANLQAVMRLLSNEMGGIVPDFLAEKLESEQAEQFYGAATEKVLTFFREQRGLAGPSMGSVDEQTAKVLNEWLTAKGLLDDPPAVHEVSGVVSDATGHRVGSVRIVALRAADPAPEQPLGEASTDGEGFYLIRFPAASSVRTPSDSSAPELLVRVYGEEGVEIGVSARTEIKAVMQLDVVVTPDRWIVEGVVRRGTVPVTGALVDVFDRDLRKRQRLGSAVTDAEGRYRVDYRTSDFQFGDRKIRPTPWLIVEARAEEESSPVSVELSESVRRHQTIDVALAVTVPSEWEQVTASVMPLLEGQVDGPDGTVDLPPHAVEETDFEFLTRETRLDADVLRAWVASSRIVQDALTRLGNDHAAQRAAFEADGWSFAYGITRQSLAANLDEVLRLAAANWEQAWTAARSLNRVPLLDSERLALVVQALELLQSLRQLDPVQGDEGGLARVLAQSPVELPVVVALDALAIYRDKGLDDPDAFLALIEARPAAAGAIRTFVRTVRVHLLVSGNEALLPALNARLEGDSDSIAPLAAMPAAEWMSLAEGVSVSPGLALKVQAQAEILHPLTALRARVVDGDVDLPGTTRQEIAELIEGQGAAVESILRGLTPVRDGAGAEAPASHRVLRDVGRFVRTGLNLELTGHLMNADIRTPAAAIRRGQELIEAQAAEKVPEAVASEVVDSFFGYVKPLLNGGNGFLIDVGASTGAPAWMRDGDDATLPDEVRAELPSIPSLFGDLDECVCKPCDSMLSQSAYLVDLLNLLQQCPSTVDGQPSAYQVLAARRRDIPELDLTCTSEKVIQHIDLVLEILEDATGAQPYAATASAIFPWRLPFDRDRAEAVAYLARLKAARLDLLLHQAAPDAQHVAAETLGVSVPQSASQSGVSGWTLIAQSRTEEALWSAYGMTPDEQGNVVLVDPASGQPLGEMSVWDALASASVLLDRTGLALEDLDKMLATRFVGPAELSQRTQCKTSNMSLPWEGSQLQGILDRLHRFVRLHARLPRWTIVELDRALAVCGGLENEDSTDAQRAAALVALAHLKRLQDRYALPVAVLLREAGSPEALRKALGLSVTQLAMLQSLTGLDPASSAFDAQALERFCEARSRIREAGLTVEQAAVALLPRLELERLGQDRAPSLKSAAQLEALLKSLQQRLRAVVAATPGLSPEAQATESLSAIFEAATAAEIVQAIVSAGEPDAQDRDPASALLAILCGTSGATHELGAWSPLLIEALARQILSVNAANKADAETRFALLLEAVAARRRESELVTAIAEQWGMPASDVVPLLGDRLKLDPAQGQPSTASDVLLDSAFWAGEPPPDVSPKANPRLYPWMDRLNRLVILAPVLGLDGELLQLADRVAVGSDAGIDWRTILASAAAAASPDWQALLDLVWLQRPEHASRSVLFDLTRNLQARGTQAALAETLRPLAIRVELGESQTLDIAAQAATVSNARALRNPTSLRRVFERLLLARQLGATPDQLAQLADPTDNGTAAATALALAKARADAADWDEASQSTADQLRAQRRDALVAYLVAHRRLAGPTDLYEHYLIDPQVEPCLRTTPILEAITATQLFAQRILFGLEGTLTAGADLKQRWTWMRNYRVWEANRKVFLFPENWLYPELRDDKSSSFTQLESALGQGELTQDLAREAFGLFLDDVAQMGQVQVLGMYEDVARDANGEILGDVQPDKQKRPIRRKLYVIGRTFNPPYAYFWRQCEDFGTSDMEWSPWRRIELDIQGDHVLPFVLGGNLYVAWPLIRRQQDESKIESWELKFAWSRYDGKQWRRSNTSRNSWNYKVASFSDERRGFAFRCDTRLDGSAVKISVYSLTESSPSNEKIPDSSVRSILRWGNDTYPGTALNVDAAIDFLKNVILNSYPDAITPVIFKSDVYPTPADEDNKLPLGIRRQLFLYCYVKKNWDRTRYDGGRHGASDGLLKPSILFLDVFPGPPDGDGTLVGGRTLLFSLPEFSEKKYTTFIGFKYPAAVPGDPNNTWIPSSDDVRNMVAGFIREYWNDANRKVNTDIFGNGGVWNYQYFERFYQSLRDISSKRIIVCHARIELVAPDNVNTTSFLELTSQDGIYTSTIDGPLGSLRPGETLDLPWQLGKQPQIDVELTLTVDEIKTTGTKSLTLKSSATLPEIPAGFETRQHVYFDFDGKKYNAMEIGFDLDARRQLALVSEFSLSRDDIISKLETTNQSKTILNPISSARPWMNGFREIASRQAPQPQSPLQIAEVPSGTISIFDSSSNEQFWVVGSNSASNFGAPDKLPLTWSYSESNLGCYIDLGYTVGLSDSGFVVYPAAYKEATLRRSHWFEFQTFDEPALQCDSFGAELLPTPKIGEAEIWNKTRGGALAFDARLPYACYNWEVFFHAPLLIADQLSKQHKFEDAERWLRFVFDPTSGEPGTDPKPFLECGEPKTDSKPFLKFRVFRKLDLRKQVIADLTALAQAAAGRATDADLAAIKKLIDRWRDAPFRPFLIARRRHIAFLWRTLFAYLDNLIAWADSLYRRDTRESLNEATLLYVLAERILGRRPKRYEGGAGRAPMQYADLLGKWDDFANFWIDVGTIGREPDPESIKSVSELPPPSPDGRLYFCMPHNDKIDSYWNTIEERLFNLRHCRNIEGVERSLPFTDAPIDPELLVRATAAGLDLGDVIAGLYAPPPHYRYGTLAARAADLANEAKALGAAMLSAIEKGDAERLAQLRSTNEIALLTLVHSVRTLQVAESERNLEALRASRKTVGARYAQYQRLLGKKEIQIPVEQGGASEEAMLGTIDSGLSSNRSNLGLIKEENEQYVGFEGAATWSVAAGIAKVVSGAAHIVASALVPNPTDKVTSASLAWKYTGDGAAIVGDGFSTVSQAWRNYAEQQGMMAGHLRRRDEWAFQSNQALKELQQIDRQILANDIRVKITKKELDNHIEQIEQAKAVDEIMRSKFSNAQLYQWMLSQLSGLHFSAYRMALELARRAERAAARELGVDALNILRNDYWDSLRSGLLAGERLAQDIKRLEAAYLEQNRRELEITRHVSLRQLDPAALLALRATGTCDFALPEWLFDLDFPGHYFRRIKTVSVSLPCVVGPYTSVSGTLTLLSSQIRDKPARTASGEEDPNKRLSYIPIQSIATSTAQNDSGLFELNFRDERYLPFEGAGAESTWRFQLPEPFRAFDYESISDLVLHLRYTARNGGKSLRDAAQAAVAADGDFIQLLSLKQDFAAELAARGANATSLTLTLGADLRPYICRTGFELKDEQVYLWKRGGAMDGTAYTVSKENEKDTVVLTISDSDLALDPHLILHFVKHAPAPSSTSITS